MVDCSGLGLADPGAEESCLDERRYRPFRSRTPPARHGLAGVRPARPAGTTRRSTPAAQARPHWHAVSSLAGRASGLRVAQAPLGRGPAPDPRERRHLQRLRRPQRDGPPLAARPDPAADRRRPTPRPLEAGLIQRARLLEARPADLYGPQRTARATACSRPNWSSPTRASCGRVTACSVPGGRYLHLYAANLGRGAGRPVSASSATAPRPVRRRLRAGEPHRPVADAAGRVPRLPGAAARPVLPDAPRHAARRSPRGTRDNPRIVLLTPGPYNETYFEHAYLARYLGYTLVEGGDLTVRDNRVFLKVLGGLQPVDVIFRRLDDDFCDPLELRPDSFLGVPGLVQAVRRGQRGGGQRPRQRAARDAGAAGLPAAPVPGAAGRGPAAALGRRRGGAASPRRCEHVLAHLDELVIKPAFARACAWSRSSPAS